tara:strand:- start:3030 stop:3698 length:669 start_codon:yes stop_codon:yes gene_type:complete
MGINLPSFENDYMQFAKRMLEKSEGTSDDELMAHSDEPTPTAKLSCLRTWGVPERIIKNLENLKTTKAVNIVKNWADTPREAWCLILSADKGTGKSTAAATWLYDMASEAPTYLKRYWWSGTRIARTNGYAKEFESMMQSRYMVIDDLGVEYLDKNGNFLQRLDELIDERYSNFRKTIITTNLNTQAFKERYGERVADRIREGFHSGGAFMELSDASMRTQK